MTNLIFNLKKKYFLDEGPVNVLVIHIVNQYLYLGSLSSS